MVEAKTAYRGNFLFFCIFLVTSFTNFAFAFFLSLVNSDNYVVLDAHAYASASVWRGNRSILRVANESHAHNIISNEGPCRGWIFTRYMKHIMRIIIELVVKCYALSVTNNKYQWNKK